jgi:uncharacterized protein with von Willebrand factor type A (vWA) domain
MNLSARDRRRARKETVQEVKDAMLELVKVQHMPEQSPEFQKAYDRVDASLKAWRKALPHDPEKPANLDEDIDVMAGDVAKLLVPGD